MEDNIGEDTMLQLSFAEDLALQGLRWACRPLAVRLVLWMVALLAIHWLIKRMLGYDDGASECVVTLYDPNKLKDMLQQFALPHGGHPSKSRSERHHLSLLFRELNFLPCIKKEASTAPKPCADSC